MGITCNLCGSNNITDWFQMSSDRFYASEKRMRDIYTIARCNDCELVFVKELPTSEELMNIYSEGYYKGTDKDGFGDYSEKLEEQNYISKMIRRLRAFLNKPKKLAGIEYAIRRHTFKGDNKTKDISLINKCVGKRGKLLDVGCAMGAFLASAKADGWDVEGVEISQYGSQHARDTLKVNVFNGSLGEAIKAGQIQAGSFDVVTLWDALEHLTDPASVFNDVNYALKDGGWFFFSTVNIDSLLAKREGESWHFFRPPKHLFYYSEKTLKAYLDKYGFTVTMDDDYRKDLIVVGARKKHSPTELYKM